MMKWRGTKVCPRCAERVKIAARVCRYCGHEFADDHVPTIGAAVASDRGLEAGEAWRRPALIASIIVAALLLVGVLGWAMSPSIDGPRSIPRVARERPPASRPIPQAPAGPELAIGETLGWSAEKAPAETVRQVGPLVVRVSRRSEDGMVAPVFTVSRGDDRVTMTGEMVGATYTHRISAVRNIAGAPPIVMLQSFSGGAHCCNHVQLAGLSGGSMKVVDLGSWDGDELPVPTDLDGDGVADFVERDDAFLYAFAAYAMSHAPPKILNVVGGRVVDVSRRPGFRRLYLDEMAKAGAACRTAVDGMDRNGACPSYLASAARVGRLDRAWKEMMASYSATEEWEYPTGCSVRTDAACPESSRITYESYPEALLVFLKENGYVPAGWTPRSIAMTEPDAQAEPERDESGTT